MPATLDQPNVYRHQPNSNSPSTGTAAPTISHYPYTEEEDYCYTDCVRRFTEKLEALYGYRR